MHIDEIKTAVQVSNNHMQPITFEFSSNNPNWMRDPEYNKFFILHTMQRINEYLNSGVVVFLNDVLARLGIARNEPGQILGWWDKPVEVEVFIQPDGQTYELTFQVQGIALYALKGMM